MRVLSSAAPDPDEEPSTPHSSVHERPPRDSEPQPSQDAVGREKAQSTQPDDEHSGPRMARRSGQSPPAKHERVSSWPAPPVPRRSHSTGDTAAPSDDTGHDSRATGGSSATGGRSTGDDTSALPDNSNLRASEIRDLLSAEPPETGGGEQPGMRLGSYRLEEIIGEGAMGHVYRAEHVLLKRKVAVKVLRSELTADQEALDRFFTEARSVAALGHPNIVEVTDFVREENGPTYYVMELLEGQDLATICSQRRIPPEEALDIVLQICDALESVHAAGIVHRDVKPENIVIDARGDHEVAKLLDFGVAKLTNLSEEGVQETASGLMVGTPAYMAPEQACGEHVDHRTDIYAVGVMLFELLTGQLPFDKEALPALVQEIVHTPAPRPSDIAELPESCRVEIDILLGICLAKNPAQRPQSAGELADGLRSIAVSLQADRLDASGLRPSRRPSGIFDQKDEERDVPVDFRPGWRRGWAAAALLLILVVGVGWYYGMDAPPSGEGTDPASKPSASASAPPSREPSDSTSGREPAGSAGGIAEGVTNDSAGVTKVSDFDEDIREDIRDEARDDTGRSRAAPQLAEDSSSSSEQDEQASGRQGASSKANDEVRDKAGEASSQPERSRGSSAREASRRHRELSRRRSEDTSRSKQARSGSRGASEDSSESSQETDEPPAPSPRTQDRDDVLNPFGP